MPYDSNANLASLINAVTFDEPEVVDAIAKEHKNNETASTNNIDLKEISPNLNLETLLQDIDLEQSSQLEKIRWTFLENIKPRPDFVKEYVYTPRTKEEYKLYAAWLFAVGSWGFATYRIMPEMFNLGIGALLAGAAVTHKLVSDYASRVLDWMKDRLNPLHVEAAKNLFKKATEALNIANPYKPRSKKSGDNLIKKANNPRSNTDYSRTIIAVIEYLRNVNDTSKNFLDEEIEAKTGIDGKDITDMFLKTDLTKFPDAKPIIEKLIPLGYQTVYDLLIKLKKGRLPKKSPVSKETLEDFVKYVRSQIVYTKIDLREITNIVPRTDKFLESVSYGGPFTIEGGTIKDSFLAKLGVDSSIPPIIRRKGSDKGIDWLEHAENGLVYFDRGLDQESEGTLKKATGGTYVFHGSPGIGVAEDANDSKNPLVIICIDTHNRIKTLPIEPSANGGIYAQIQRQDDFKFKVTLYRIKPDKDKNAQTSYNNIKKELDLIVTDIPLALKITENYTRQYIQDWHSSRKVA